VAQRYTRLWAEERNRDVTSLAPAQSAAAREQRHDRLESYAGASGGNALGKVCGRDLAASSARDAVQDVLDDLGGNRRDIDDLMPDRIIDGVRAAQRRATGAAAIRMQLDAAIDFLGPEWHARLSLVPGLASRLAPRGLLLAPLLPRLVRRRRLRGVGRVLVETRGEFPDLVLENGVVLAQPVILADQACAVRLEVADAAQKLGNLLLELVDPRLVFRHTSWIGQRCEGAERLLACVSVHLESAICSPRSNVASSMTLCKANGRSQMFPLTFGTATRRPCGRRRSRGVSGFRQRHVCTTRHEHSSLR
jgi:hypothetical protein